MSEVRRDAHPAWLQALARPALAAVLALWAASWLAAATLLALTLAGCTLRLESLGVDGLSRTTLSLFSDDQSAFACSTAPDGTATVSLGAQSNPNADSLGLAQALAALLAPGNPAARSRTTPQAAAACAPFSLPDQPEEHEP